MSPARHNSAPTLMSLVTFEPFPFAVISCAVIKKQDAEYAYPPSLSCDRAIGSVN